MKKEGVVILSVLLVITLLGFFLMPEPTGQYYIEPVIYTDTLMYNYLNGRATEPKVIERPEQVPPEAELQIIKEETEEPLDSKPQALDLKLQTIDRLPDLIIIDAVFKQRNKLVPFDLLAADVPIDIILTLKNQGSFKTPKEQVQLEYQINGKHEGFMSMVASLEPGESMQVQGGPKPWLKKGTHELTVYVDRSSFSGAKNNRIKELNEDNNVWTQALTAEKFKRSQPIDCNANNVCELEESILSCPHDCMPKEKYQFCKNSKLIWAVQELEKIRGTNILARKIELNRKSIILEKVEEILEGRAGHYSEFSDGTKIYVADVTLPLGSANVLALVCLD